MSAPHGFGPRLACREAAPERLLLPGVHVFFPGTGADTPRDLLLEEGVIAAIGDHLPVPSGASVLEELRGRHVFPGFVDPHVHLRTPGQEYKEDLASGSRAAAAGGFVTIIGMANTSPPVDSAPLATWVLDQASQSADVRVGQVAAVSQGLKGEQLSEMRELIRAGVVAFSDDGRPVEDADLLRQALRYLRGLGRPLLLHLEDRSLSADAVMHEGRWSARLGLRGMPATSESGPLAVLLEALRLDVAAGERQRPRRSPCPVHVQHVSTAAAVRLLRQAKAEGLPVTAEATPHHLLLTDELVATFDTSLRVNPPLRSEEDRQAVVGALADGTIDCVGTDHAPHAPQEKEVPFEEAMPGCVGLETAFAALYGGLVVPGAVSLERLIDALSSAPSRCLGLPAPRLETGAPADFCVVDLDERWTVGVGDLRGKSRNCAFLGRGVQGRVVLTVVGGVRRYERAREATDEGGRACTGVISPATLCSLTARSSRDSGSPRPARSSARSCSTRA